MTTGIYLLEFSDGTEYVGQAVDIERRWEQHSANMWGNKAAHKMQAAFKKCGLPTFNILVECHKDHLDLLEAYYIQQREPLLNTSLPKRLSDWELQMVSLNMVQFKESILGIIHNLASEQETINTLETKIEEEHASVLEWIERYQELTTKRQEDICAELKQEYDEFVEEATDRELELDKLLRAFQEAVVELETEIIRLKKPWWKKIFN